MNNRAFPHTCIRGLALLGLIGMLTTPGRTNPVMPPIDGVEVLVENVVSGKIAATKTEESVRFMLSSLAPGEYRLIIRIARRAAPSSPSKSANRSAQLIGYDVRPSVYGGAITSQWVPTSSPKVRVGIVFAVPTRARGTIAGTIKPAAPPAAQTHTTWPLPRR